jgi:hypothetical protein
VTVIPQIAVEDMKEVIERDYLPGYKFLSARTALEVAGYNFEEIMEVLQYIAANGFEYCLDHYIKHTYCDMNSPNRDQMITEFPSARGCVWGPDQLLSRLNGVRTYIPE